MYSARAEPAVDPLPPLPADALDDRIAIVGTAGSGKTYAAKGFIERLLDTGARVTIVDPLGVWWGLRASADGSAAGYPVVVFGGRHADVPITAEMGAALGRMIAREALVCVVDLSELGSNAARRHFMAAFSEALYDANEEPLHLVLDEADLWAPQRPIKGWEGLLGHIEEIVRRGRVRGFTPWLITQRPAVVHKDVLSQADILIAMKLTASQGPRRDYTDTVGATDHVFGLCCLLGFQFPPRIRIRDLKDRKLYTIEKPTTYPPLEPLIGEAIDSAVIIGQWPELMRLKASIEAGAVYDFKQIVR
jgi:DNA helicase HerA-like ATPase